MEIKKVSIFLVISLVIFIAIVCCVNIFNGNEGAKEVNNYRIPKMYFTGDIQNMEEKTDKRQIKVKYESDSLNFESYALLKIQGSFSLRFDKKNYNITFYEDSEYTTKQKIDIKWGEYNKYTLKANWEDPLHARNIVTANMASELNKKYGILTDSVNYGLTDGFPIEIYANDEFLGLYTLNMHKDNLFNMDKENENNIALFVETMDNNAFSQLETEEWKNYEVEKGEQNKETLDKLNRVIDFIINSTDEEFVKDFSNYFNLDSVLNYYCFMNFAHLVDNVSRNMFLVTYDGKVWYMVPYDFDLSWGNEFRDESIITDYHNLHTGSYIKTSPLWSRFKKLFKNEINERYTELRQDILTKENVLNKMNSFYKLIPDETLKKEQAKWNNKPNYERNYIEDYLDKELKILDNIYLNK